MALTFKILIILTVIQRISELFLSKSHEKRILAKGGFIAKEPNYIFMVLLHTSWLISLFYFAFFSSPEFLPQRFFLFIGLFVSGQFFRILAIKTLGERWTTRIAILKKEPVLKKGIFKYIKHPNYLGVCLEIFSLPAAIGLYQLALFFSFINFIIIYFRISLEEKLLRKHSSFDEVFYKKEFKNGQ